MKIERDGDSLVSTPIFAGLPESVARAARCCHEFEPVGPQTETPRGKGLMQMERCRRCVAAVRFRITPAPGVSFEDFVKSEEFTT
jgi:hypothetical protein